MEQNIMDFLTRKVLYDPHFQANPHARIRHAYIKARKLYKKLSVEEKERIINYLKNKQ